MPVYVAQLPDSSGMVGALRVVASPDCGSESLSAVHTRAYLESLASARPDLWLAIQRSGHSAVAAASWASRAGMEDSVAFALSYPDGRHAHRGQARMGCYVNNQAIAANTLLQSVDRVVIFSIGPVHADGIQDVFYERADVMTISLHWESALESEVAIHMGIVEERGSGVGYGYNLNFPLTVPLCDTALIRTLEKALGALQDYRVQAIVLSLHCHVVDRGGMLGRELGQRIRALALPTVVMLESAGPAVDTLFETEGFFPEFLSVMT